MPGQLLGVEMTVYLLAFRSLCPLHCECLMYKSSQDALRNADAAFVGRIIASRDTLLIKGEGPGDPYLIFTFLVERRWKGPDSAQIEVVTPFDSAPTPSTHAPQFPRDLRASCPVRPPHRPRDRAPGRLGVLLDLEGALHNHDPPRCG